MVDYFIGVGSGIVLGLIFAINTGQENNTIIEKGYAYYHPQTGEFTWKEIVNSSDYNITLKN